LAIIILAVATRFKSSVLKKAKKKTKKSHANKTRWCWSGDWPKLKGLQIAIYHNQLFILFTF